MLLFFSIFNFKICDENEIRAFYARNVGRKTLSLSLLLLHRVVTALSEQTPKVHIDGRACRPSEEERQLDLFCMLHRVRMYDIDDCGWFSLLPQAAMP